MTLASKLDKNRAKTRCFCQIPGFHWIFYTFSITGDFHRWVRSINNMSDGPSNKVENKTFERTDLQWCFLHAHLPVHPPIRFIPLSVFLERPWRALKSADFQSLKTEAETKESHHRVSKRVTDWESERDWVIHQKQAFERGENPRQTAAHTSMHLHTHAHTDTPWSAHWPTLLWMESSSQRALGLS